MVMKLREEQKYGSVGFGERGGKEREKREVNTRDAYRYIYTHTHRQIYMMPSDNLSHSHTRTHKVCTDTQINLQ